MKSIIIIGFAVLACVYAHPYDFNWDRGMGGGRIYGTLGDRDDGSLFGRAGYKGNFFDDNRGKLSGDAFGSRVLGPNGDSSYLGGNLNWKNAARDTEANLAVAKEIHGMTSGQADISKVWTLDKNTHIKAGATASQADIGHGKVDYGVAATLEHTFGQ